MITWCFVRTCLERESESRNLKAAAAAGFHAEVLVQREQSRARSREQLEEVHGGVGLRPWGLQGLGSIGSAGF